MPRVIFIAHDGRTQEAQARTGDSVMQTGLDHGVTGILADCGGSCACATCHCYVDEAWVQSFVPAAAVEAELVSFAFVTCPPPAYQSKGRKSKLKVNRFLCL